MKKILFSLFIASIILLSGCVKIKDTYVIVTVLNNNGNNVGSGTIVHMFEESPESSFGDNPMFAKASMTTDSDGKAEFLLPPGNFVDDGYDIITRFFTIFEISDDPLVDDKVIGTVSLNIEYGETKEITIVLSE